MIFEVRFIRLLRRILCGVSNFSDLQILNLLFLFFIVRRLLRLVGGMWTGNQFCIISIVDLILRNYLYSFSYFSLWNILRNFFRVLVWFLNNISDEFLFRVFFLNLCFLSDEWLLISLTRSFCSFYLSFGILNVFCNFKFTSFLNLGSWNLFRMKLPVWIFLIRLLKNHLILTLLLFVLLGWRTHRNSLTSMINRSCLTIFAKHFGH